MLAQSFLSHEFSFLLNAEKKQRKTATEISKMFTSLQQHYTFAISQNC